MSVCSCCTVALEGRRSTVCGAQGWEGSLTPTELGLRAQGGAVCVQLRADLQPAQVCVQGQLGP